MSSSAHRLIIEQSRTGAPTGRVGGRYLHSRFDPRREANRFIDQIDLGDPRLILFLGPGLGHAIVPLRTRFPQAKIVGLFFHASTYSEASSACDGAWHPGAAESLRAFLTRSVPEVLIGRAGVVEWQPCLDAFAETGETIRSEVTGFLHESQASLFTSGAGGRLRLHNALKNVHRVQPTSWQTDPADRVSAIVVAGAGPSLEWTLPVIERVRQSISLWATGSAVEALRDSNLTPDVIVVTEPSVYASFHLRSLISVASEEATRAPVILAPVSVCSTVAECRGTAFFAENDLTEQLLAPALPELPIVPSHGTVTFTAVGAARSFGAVPIVLTGADFAHFEERSHVRPHLAHRYRRSIANRTAPGAGFVFERSRTHSTLSGGWSTDRTLSTYGHWLRSRGRELFAPLYELAPSRMETGLPLLTENKLTELPAAFGRPTFLPVVRPLPNVSLVRQTLRRAAQRVSRAKESLPPAIEALPGADITKLAVNLAVQRLLRYAKTGERTEWIELCSEVERELDRASEFVS